VKLEFWLVEISRYSTAFESDQGLNLLVICIKARAIFKFWDLREDFHPFELISPVQICDVSLVGPSDNATMTSQSPPLNLLPYPFLMNLLDRVFETPRDLLNLRKTSREFYFLINNTQVYLSQLSLIVVTDTNTILAATKTVRS
jgi:hypothetical protein